MSMIDDHTLHLHDLIASGHLHQARDLCSRQLAEIERGMIAGDAVDPCGQGRDGKCVHRLMVKTESLWKADD